MGRKGNGDPLIRHLLPQLILPDAGAFQHGTVRCKIIRYIPEKRSETSGRQQHNPGKLIIYTFRMNLLFHVCQILFNGTQFHKRTIQIIRNSAGTKERGCSFPLMTGKH